MASSSERKRLSLVFLSFEGTGVPCKFLSRLHATLNREGINTSIDREQLEKGEHISPVLMEVIEESPTAIIIFSRNLASSIGCLEEVAKIMECKEQRDLRVRVIPVFYKVDPREVILQRRRHRYKKAIGKQESKFGKDLAKVEMEKKAPFNAGSLSG